MANLRVLTVLMVLVVALLLAIEFYTTGVPGVSSDPVTDEAVTGNYPALYEDIYRRDAGALRPWLGHSDSTMRAQAWRAMANTPVDSAGRLVDRVLAERSPQAWFALSMHELEADQLRRLEERWRAEPALRSGISLVLGRQGDAATMDFMLGRLAESDSSAWESPYAMGLSRLITRHPLSAAGQQRVIAQAFDRSDPDVVRRYLYGFYRGPESPLGEEVLDRARSAWGSYGMGVAGVDRFALGLLGERIFHELTTYYNSDQMLEHRVQLALELAAVLEEVPLNDRHLLDASFLVRHANPHVRAQALQSLLGRLPALHSLYGYISGELLATEAEPGVWLEALALVAGSEGGIPEDHQSRLDNIMSGEPYYLDRALRLYRAHHSPGEYLGRLEELIASGESLTAMQAVRSLAGFAAGPEGGNDSEEFRERIRSAAFRALRNADRGVAYALRGLFSSERFFGSGDYDRIRRALSRFELPADVEVFQAYGSLFYDRYREQAAPFVDSLAALEYAPLNRSLAGAGWEVDVPDTAAAEFRQPDWQRLWKMGRHPVWELRTGKGTVAVRLDLLSAPATVAAVDSLTMAGAYDGVPFHRVVPNFVIQGGDIERADGFGGPDFVIPTEGSEKEFSRGAAGIASAGTDTEGSQYFIMHQWAPHLNGAYTRFGEVVEGMGVVDRITVGDTVRTAGWR